MCQVWRKKIGLSARVYFCLEKFRSNIIITYLSSLYIWVYFFCINWLYDEHSHLVNLLHWLSHFFHSLITLTENLTNTKTSESVFDRHWLIHHLRRPRWNPIISNIIRYIILYYYIQIIIEIFVVNIKWSECSACVLRFWLRLRLLRGGSIFQHISSS